MATCSALILLGHYTETTNLDQLRAKHAGDIFYVSMELLRPPVLAWPKKALDDMYARLEKGRKILPFDDGRAVFDRNTPKEVIMGPAHAYLVYVDDLYDYFASQKKGAKAIPVIIIRDDSAVFDEGKFWERLQREGRAYLFDINGKLKAPPSTFKDFPDAPFVSVLSKLIPEIYREGRKENFARKIYKSTDYPIAFRDGDKEFRFLLYRIAGPLKKRIVRDDPSLTPLLTDASAPITEAMADRMRALMLESFNDGDFSDDAHVEFQGLYPLKQKTKFDDINFRKEIGYEGQITVIEK